VGYFFFNYSFLQLRSSLSLLRVDILKHALRRGLLVWVYRMTAVAGTIFTNPVVSVTKSNFRLLLNFYYCCIPWGCGKAKRH